VKIHRQYKLMSMPAGRIDQAILEIVTEEGQPERRSEFAGFMPGTRHETQFDMVEALNRAYRQGREDRAADIPPEEPASRAQQDSEAAHRKIRQALTDTEKARIVNQAVIAEPRLRGAHYDDILEMADDTDYFTGTTEPFFDLNRGWPQGARYAAIAVCAQGRPLTWLSLSEIMTRAGLLPVQRA
jgi:hypothetical protein